MGQGLRGMFAPVTPGLDGGVADQLARRGLMQSGMSIMGGALTDPSKQGFNGVANAMLQGQDSIQKQAMAALESQRRQKQDERQLAQDEYRKEQDTLTTAHRDRTHQLAIAANDRATDAAGRAEVEAFAKEEERGREAEERTRQEAITSDKYPSVANLDPEDRGAYIAGEESKERGRQAQAERARVAREASASANKGPRMSLSRTDLDTGIADELMAKGYKMMEDGKWHLDDGTGDYGVPLPGKLAEDKAIAEATVATRSQRSSRIKWINEKYPMIPSAQVLEVMDNPQLDWDAFLAELEERHG